VRRTELDRGTEAARGGRPHGGAPPDRRKRVLFALMLTLALVAMDATIVGTAVPSIVADLGGFSLFPWMFSIYLVAQAVSTPIYGKLADQYGRKPIIMIGATIFLAGSVLCGLAPSMVALIAFRGVQGLGAGAIQPITQTIVGDLYSVRERAAIQGYLSSVWGVSAVLGPTVGGLLTEYASWHWLFFVNLPVGGAALFMLAREFRETVQRVRHSIDYAGSALLVAGLSLIITVLLQGGSTWAWGSPPVVALATIGVMLIVGFAAVERSVAEPVVPLWVLRERRLLAPNLGTVALGMIMMALTTYLPVFVQVSLGERPIVAGFALAAMSMGWPLASALSSRLYLRIGFRNTAMIGFGVAAFSGLLFLQLESSSAAWQAGAGSFVTGVGLGLGTTSFIVGIQSLVDWRRRGTATGSNMFARLVGAALGVAVFGSIVNSTLAGRLATAPAGLARELGSLSTVISRLSEGDSLPPEVVTFVRDSLSAAMDRVFLGVVVVGVAGLAVQLLAPARGGALTLDDPSRSRSH
jgi:EmrB/QacA subfamily drug resistance transporter